MRIQYVDRVLNTRKIPSCNYYPTRQNTRPFKTCWSSKSSMTFSLFNWLNFTFYILLLLILGPFYSEIFSTINHFDFVFTCTAKESFKPVKVSFLFYTGKVNTGQNRNI